MQKLKFLSVGRLVEQKNADIMASVRYAKTIQNAILPHDDQLKISKEQQHDLRLKVFLIL
jgi:hypothetical protein